MTKLSNLWALFPFPPTCKFLHVNLSTTLSDCYDTYNYIKTNKATTNIFGLNIQLRKTTRYTNIPGLTSIEEKCLSYSFIYEVYEKNAYCAIIMYENYKVVILS